jgi:outer membrane protein OmpA-like peptidoglycan-associated protein
MAVTAGALACAGTRGADDLPTSANPDEEISRLATQVEQARSENVDILSPGWFARASESLDDARSLRKEGGSVDEILGAVSEGRASLKQARSFAKVSSTTLAVTIEARGAARTAGAPALGTSYDEVEEEFLSLTRGIENDKLNRAQQQRDAVAQQYRKLELTAIKSTTLADVRKTLDAAVNAGAAKVAPEVLAVAQGKLRSTEKFIAEDRYATAQMNERAEEALFYANRALAITRWANETKRETPVQRALDEEAFLFDLAAALGTEDLRDRGIADQRRVVISSAEELRKDRDFLVTRNELLRSEKDQLGIELTSVRGTATALEEDRRFNLLYAEVRSYFDSDQAEVYKQGDVLLIRLGGIQFPVGDYVIQPEDYALLTRVQMAIRAFGDPNVLIEGHTDSTGSQNVNQQLSKRRAEAVRAYLIANNVLPPEQITAVGKADSVPLAPNTTAEGRALNRRIDVIIVPQRALRAVAAEPPSE